ncbi:MAG: hypothetical protein HY720_23025 [Planctomycetes bacterium]|nr:hypothetical protein [Planctomycetota bacterium]
MIQHRAIPTLAFLLSLTLAACGGGGDDGKSGDEAKPRIKEGEKGNPEGALEIMVRSPEKARSRVCELRMKEWAKDVAAGTELLRSGDDLIGEKVPFLLLERSVMLGHELRMLHCPSVHHDSEPPDPQAVESRDPSATDYEGPDGITITREILREPRKFPILWDQKDNHIELRHVLYLDGTVAVVKEAEFTERVLGYIESLRQAQKSGG